MKTNALKSILLLLLTNIIRESSASEICESEGCRRKYFRTKRGVKDPFDKEDVISEFVNMEYLRGKIDDAQNGINTYRSDRDSKAESLERQADTFEIELLKQKALFTRLQKDIGELKDGLIARGAKIGALSELREAEMENSYFTFSNNTCGEVMISKTGSIVFEDFHQRETLRDQKNCIWTIRTNHYSMVKITTHSLFRNSTSFIKKPKDGKAYIVEMDPNSINPFKIKITDLKSKGTHVCAGPIVFVVYSLNPYERKWARDYYSDVYADLNLQFEGIDRSISRKTHYSHVTVHSQDGFTFNSTELYKGQTAKDNFTDQYNTIVVSKFATKVVLDIDFDRTQCSDNDTFVVLNSLQSSNSLGYDCCKFDCNTAFVGYDSPILMIITSKFNKSLNFMLRLKMDAILPQNSGHEMSSGTTYPCGGVVGGDYGLIEYKTYYHYSDRERCIWTIVPQPVPKSSINITLVRSGVESFYDHLYMMEITDINGTILKDAPRITRLEAGTYQAHSREVYIVFYSDDSVTGTGFKLGYKVTGEHDAHRLEFMDEFSTHQQFEGNVSVVQTLSSKSRRTISVTPKMVPDAYENVMRMKIEQNYVSQINGSVANYIQTCVTQPNVNVFTAKKGLFTRSQLNFTCANSSVTTLAESSEEMALIVLTDIDEHPQDVHTVMSWEMEPVDGNKSYVVTDESKCGGVIIGERGAIRYKPANSYLNNERCIWTILAPSKSSINLTLRKDGFEKCCDYIMATGVEADLGILSPNRFIINRENSTATIYGAVAVIVFQSDSGTTGTGFNLLFETFGNASESNYTYTAIHRNLPDTYTPPRTLESDETGPHSYDVLPKKNILIFTYNNDAPGKVKGSLKQSKFRNWNNSNEEICEYESLSGYIFGSPYAGPDHDDKGWKKLRQPFDPSLYQMRIRTNTEVEETTDSAPYFADEGTYASGDNEEYTQPDWSKYGKVVFESSETQSSGSGWNEYDDLNNESGSGSGVDGGMDDLYQSKARLETRLTCQSMIKVNPIDDWISNQYGAFAVIHKSFYPNPQIEFDWKLETKCGGIFVGASGVIDYKDGEPYSADERCMWLVKVPGASAIQFNMVKNGFENGYDYVSVASIDPISGNVGSLSDFGRTESYNSSYRINSPLAIVFFNSDSSRNGYGFRLTFNKILTAPSPHPFEYRLISLNRDQHHEFATEMEPNEMLIIAVQGFADSLRYIRTTVFRPRVNQDCDSDQLTFYQFPQPDYGIRTAGVTILAKDVLPTSLTRRGVDGQCPLVKDEDLSQCSQIELCLEKPYYRQSYYGNAIYASAYFVIYKPILTPANTTANSTMRGFAFRSSTRSLLYL